MADVVTPLVRSRMMASIRGADTKPELFIRRGLHRLGFRFRLDDRTLPGRPDIVFPKYHAVLFVHGCFWHRHDCHLFKWPGSREDFWKKKLNGNAERDRRNIDSLEQTGWRVGIVWECATRGRTRQEPDSIFSTCSDWLLSDGKSLMIKGR